MTPESRETRALFLSIPTAAKLMGITPERLTKAIAAHQISAIVIGAQKVVARATIEKLAQLERGAA